MPKRTSRKSEQRAAKRKREVRSAKSEKQKAEEKNSADRNDRIQEQQKEAEKKRGERLTARLASIREFQERMNASPEETERQVEAMIVREIVPRFEASLVVQTAHAEREAEPLREELRALAPPDEAPEDQGEVPEEFDPGPVLKADLLQEAKEYLKAQSSPNPCPRRPILGAVFAEIAVPVEGRFRGIDRDYIRAVLDHMTLRGKLTHSKELLRVLPEGDETQLQDVWRSPQQNGPAASKFSVPNTIEAWAKRFDVHPNTMAKYLKDGQVRGKKVGGRWSIDRRDIPVSE